ncbi:MAG: alanine--tRNA ligase [Heliobacteriaceae bacterium]|jgi:alanyl-tRNA synthetase|nr:alanine--tRNA ligase [Heliobacteriaceae bacterium]
MLSGNEIRRLYLDYFKNKHKHTVVESSGLVPDNPTVLLTTAGMLQFMPIYLGYEKPPYNPPRAASCQKCARAGGKDSDIENVGRTPRHHTFFEMLGNFAFGDYYKKELIPWAWEFVTENMKLDPERLWITVYEKDDEAFEIWTKDVGIPAHKVLRKGKKDNFWGPPGTTGSCGPCSEIHYDLGEEFKCSDNCGIDTCECDRWVEIWNLVFTELFKDEEGNFSPLEKKNVDTGMGLERITMVCQNKTSTFETDLLKPILDRVSEISGISYKASEKTDISLRIITDHARCAAFLINDGVIPGNEGRSYVLRMILRRALRHGKILGMELPFLYKLVGVIVENYKGAYPDLEANRKKVENTIRKEEERFKLTLDRGYKLMDEFIAAKRDIDGEDAFKLYDTYGFPLELTKEIAQEHGLKVDETGFKTAMQEQKERAKAAAQKISLTDDLKYAAIEEKFGATVFTGYADTAQAAQEAKILAIVEGEGFTDIVLDKTPFYAECGGQTGDTGFIESENLKAEVLTTFKVNNLFVHRTNIINGEAVTGSSVHAKINAARRFETKLHHSAAHLLQAALIKVLGSEVKQAGSQVDENRTRFDFSYPRAMTPEEISDVERIINNWISDGLDVTTVEMGIEQAKRTGAISLFGEKYGDVVRVVTMGAISKELCAGTHAANTRDIRLAKIVSESAIAAGTRRIELVVSKAAFEFMNLRVQELDKLSLFFKTQYDGVMGRAEKIQEENKELRNELGQLKTEQNRSKFAEFLSQARDFDGGRLLVSKAAGFDGNALKTGAEFLAQKLGESIIVLASDTSVAACVSDGFVQKGFNAGKIAGEIAKAAGASGGGRPNFAQGGVKDCSVLDEVLAKICKDFLN